MMRFDKYWLGILLGLIMPLALGYAYVEHYHLWSSFSSFGLGMKGVLSKLLMVSVFPNLAFLFVFYTLDMWRFAKGLLIGAFPYLFAAIYFTL